VPKQNNGIEEKIASQRLKIQRLLDQKLSATSAQLLLAIREESLARVQSHKHLIETRIADRAADHHRASSSDTIFGYNNADAAASPQ
jgi:hypothetical protein